MSVGLRLRFALVCLLLRAAQGWASFACRRLRGRAFGGESYRVWKASQEFGFDGPFDYPTVAEQPPEEAYPPLLSVSKGLVVLALKVPLDGQSTRWASMDALDRAYGLLGKPEICARAGSDGSLSDAAFLRLRRDGPHAHWVRRDGDGWLVDYRDLLTGLPRAPGRRLEPCALRWDAAGMRIAVGDAWVAPGAPGWAEARRLFHLAELHVHECVSHLLWTHLYAEQVIIATVQHLPRGHAIRELLAPHFAFTLQANQNSGKVLVGAGGVFDRLFSCGWAGAAELMVRGDRAWRYARVVPGLDLADRGVRSDGRVVLPDYPWAEDSLALWDAVEQHVRRRLGGWDAAAEGWARALQATFGDRGWPAADDDDTRVQVVTACIFMTVRHTLVNAQQYPMFAHPAHWQATMPEDGRTALEQLPTVEQTLDTMRATFAFSIQYNTLLATDDPEFGADLARVAAGVEARDRAREHPYAVGHPAKVSASIMA